MKNSSIGVDAVKVTTSKMTVMIISLLSAMLLSRFRSLEEYGTYSQMLLIVNLVTTFLMFGLPNSINYFLALAETPEEKHNFLGVYYTFNTLLSIIVGIVLVSAAPFIVEYFKNQLLRDFIYVLAIYPWTQIIMSSVENILIVAKKTTIIIVYRLTNSLALLLIILIVQLFNFDFQIYMLLFVIVQVLFTIVVYIIVKNVYGKLTVLIDPRLIRKMLVFSIPIGLASMTGILNVQLDKLMIGRLLDTAQLAIYANASTELPVSIVATSLTAVLLPQMVRLVKDGEDQKAINIWGNSIILSYMFICFVATGLFTFAPEVMRILYSQKYLSGVPVFRVYIILLLLRCTYFGMILTAKGKTKFIFYSSIMSLVLNAVLVYPLYMCLGFIGPAVATFLSQLLINLIQLIFTSYLTKIIFSKIFPWKNLFIITIANFGLGALFYFIKNNKAIETYFWNYSFEQFALALLWAAIYSIIFLKQIKNQWRALK